MDNTKEKNSESLALRTTFPDYSEFVALNSMSGSLPDVIYIPFEAATADVTLTGWEDEWFSNAKFNVGKWGNLSEPKMDFVYTWVNGSDKAFTDTMYPYEVNSTLNDPEGKWLQSHRMNRYRDWDELRYSIRTVEKYAQNIRNKIQILVNSVGTEGIANKASPQAPAKITGRQTPLWLNNNESTNDIVQIIPHEDFFDESARACLPTFNSLTIENQIFNTKSTVDRFFALSDDMLLGKPHAASDLYSPLFGPTMGFKNKGFNTRNAPTEEDSHRFGERPYHIYTSWLLNRRFGERHRDGQVHFGHSMGRSVTREAIQSFPRPALQSACQRFRGQAGFQLATWFATFHYTIERHREVLLWSYITQRSDTNQDGYLDWNERKAVIADLQEGVSNEGNTTFRTRQFYRVAKSLEAVGLEAPKVNLDILWTSLDGPSSIRRLKCHNFNVTDCLGPGFSTESSDKYYTSPMFSTEAIFHRVAQEKPECGDCLLKLILYRAKKGLEPLLPHKDLQVEARETVVKALVRYQYTIVEPDALFLMVTDAEQVEHVLTKRLLQEKREVGQLCLNDDITTEEGYFVERLREKIYGLFQGLVPEQSQFEWRM
ncbi:hypothetical protein L207DRAFT_413850 [Hyaloscypha variabilis F]|uniref:Stealth protein CR2 conserved region 2 domain-containing protein n=1 Tax=Hyaloscypha variabilis (strain UAMH 11265 / GT02V1 / F) TaxID=1149755 RepID=A0A2J6SE18_HYAVF|nr:hypothetical protein L207DRAFT_413850 [Hyaloscypha variabilis F]